MQPMLCQKHQYIPREKTLICVRVCKYIPAANKAKILYGMPRDPDLALALVQMEEEESENNGDEEKPKV